MCIPDSPDPLRRKSLGSWQTIDADKANREIERATGIFPMNMGKNNVYDIFYLDQGYPVAVVVLNCNATQIKYASRSTLATMFGVGDEDLLLTYTHFRKDTVLEW
jgi:hypothetical protein